MEDNPYVASGARPNPPARRLAGPLRRFVGLLLYVAAIFPAIGIVKWLIWSIRNAGKPGEGNLFPAALMIEVTLALVILVLVWLGHRVRFRSAP